MYFKTLFRYFSFFVLFQAQTATLTIAQAFNLAFDKWKQESYCCLLLKFCKCSSLFRFILQDLSYIFLESLKANIYADQFMFHIRKNVTTYYEREQ